MAGKGQRTSIQWWRGSQLLFNSRRSARATASQNCRRRRESSRLPSSRQSQCLDLRLVGNSSCRLKLSVPLRSKHLNWFLSTAESDCQLSRGWDRSIPGKRPLRSPEPWGRTLLPNRDLRNGEPVKPDVASNTPSGLFCGIQHERGRRLTVLPTRFSSCWDEGTDGALKALKSGVGAVSQLLELLRGHLLLLTKPRLQPPLQVSRQGIHGRRCCTAGPKHNVVPEPQCPICTTPAKGYIASSPPMPSSSSVRKGTAALPSQCRTNTPGLP